MRAPRRQRRTLRNAAAAPDSSAPDALLCRAGVLQLAEVRHQNTAPWLLKEEMRRAGSLLMELARQHAVPAGHALAVDREHFSQAVTAAIEGEPLIRIVREEATAIDEDAAITIIASGPLTSDALAAEIQRLSGSEQLFFYDSISPIVEADSIDMGRAYMAARYDKGTADYINCPMTREEYDRFLDALLEAQSVDAKEWEKLNYFESCLPIEEIARRGRDTLRFGPMKPVGLRDPRTGHLPYAVVQLRQENLRADSYNLVGFQNHLKFGEQARILRLIPGLENAKFLRYGQIHRNTYIQAPALLDETLQMKLHRGRAVRGTDLGRRRLRRVHRHWTAGGDAGRGACRESRASRASALDRLRRAGALHLPRRGQTLPAGQHYLRPVAAAGRGDPPSSARQEAAPRHGLRPRARRLAALARSSRRRRGKTLIQSLCIRA